MERITSPKKSSNMILYLNHGKIIKAESQSPESNALNNLEDELH